MVIPCNKKIINVYQYNTLKNSIDININVAFIKYDSLSKKLGHLQAFYVPLKIFHL